ncbi:hypothetical protein ACPCB7_02430 [Streptomyces arboris]|uniref:hypothetical protein n=1 Tax=Streptomyces arboris TaxID=2600619 RepID=UPI003C2C7281
MAANAPLSPVQENHDGKAKTVYRLTQIGNRPVNRLTTMQGTKPMDNPARRLSAVFG